MIICHISIVKSIFLSILTEKLTIINPFIYLSTRFATVTVPYQHFYAKIYKENINLSDCNTEILKQIPKLHFCPKFTSTDVIHICHHGYLGIFQICELKSMIAIL